MTILESELSLAAPARQSGLECELDLAASLLHLARRGEPHREQPRSQPPAVERERQIAEDPRGVGSLLRLGDHSVRIAIDLRDQQRKYGHAGRQSHLCLEPVFPHREERALQVLVEPVREGRRRGENQHRGGRPGDHLAPSFRP